MRLISNAEAAFAIGAKFGSDAPKDDDPQMAEIIGNLLPKVEDALNVKSLVETTWVDHFRLPRICAKPGLSVLLRLSNGFLDSGTAVTITDPDGVETVIAADDRDDEYGIIRLESTDCGLYKVQYKSGFTPTPYVEPEDGLPDGSTPPIEQTSPVLQNVPDWLRGVIKSYLVQWYRIAVLAPKLPGKNDGRTAELLVAAIRSEIYQRICGRYMRPRIVVHWPEKCVVAA